MKCDSNSEKLPVYINNIYKKKEENPRFFRASNTDEMSTYESQQRTSHQRKCHAGQVDNEGRVQRTLFSGGHPHTPVLSDIKNDEMLKQQTSQKLVSVSVDAWCRNCGALNEEVPLNACCKVCHSRGMFHEDDTHATVYYSGDNDTDYEEYRRFKNIEAQEKLGTIEPSKDQICKYQFELVQQKAPVEFVKMFKNTGYPAYSSKVAPVNKTRRVELEGIAHMSNLADCLNSGNQMLVNWAKKIHRLTTDSCNDYKPVAINSWNKILRENKDALESINYKFEANKPTLSPKDLGNWTWKFRSADTLEKKIQMFIDAIPKTSEFPYFEHDGILEMYGSTNIPMEGDPNFYYNNIQNWNMEHMLEMRADTDNSFANMVDTFELYSNSKRKVEVHGKVVPAPITSSKNTIFVFGSNEKGIHGKGSALEARKNHGAVLGKGVGLQGSSYAIPTKETPYKTLSLEKISKYVSEFVEFAKAHPEMTFNVVAIGCANAGYTPKQIAPLFGTVPTNVNLPESFKVAN
jgi:hypothetical protein